MAKEKIKKFAVRVMGGLGNQMFEYAILRTLMLDHSSDGVLDLCGITNNDHNVYSLNHLNISDNVIVSNNFFNSKKMITHLFLGCYYRLFSKFKWGFSFYCNIQPTLNKYGIYCAPDGYIELSKSKARHNYIEGYYQSSKFFKKYEDIIRSELKVKYKVPKKNIDLYKQICNSNSVCMHIRRGDYLGGYFEVCNDDYYYDAVKVMNKKIKNTVYFIFSDDISYVKDKMNFGENKIVYVDNHNKNYEDLQLMYSCKNFILSNSSYSFWGQFLSDNKDKIVIAPSRWFNNDKKVDIYEDDWILIDVKK